MLKRPVGRPRKIVTAEEKLAKMTKAELKALLAYQDEVSQAGASDGRYHQGDVREDGKVFLRYAPIWVTPEAFARHQERNRRAALKSYHAAKANTAPALTV